MIARQKPASNVVCLRVRGREATADIVRDVHGKTLDGELLALCAKLDAQKAVVDQNCERAAFHKSPFGSVAGAALDAALDELQLAEWAIVETIINLPARTPEGLKAKARAARVAWLEVKCDPRIEDNDGDAAERLVFGLIGDLLGEN